VFPSRMRFLSPQRAIDWLGSGVTFFASFFVVIFPTCIQSQFWIFFDGPFVSCQLVCSVAIKTENISEYKGAYKFNEDTKKDKNKAEEKVGGGGGGGGGEGEEEGK
jgi:hypothetical protein